MKEALTPTPIKKSKPVTMSFFDALRAIQQGKRVTRISWGNHDYCLFKDSFLTIYTKGEFHSWIINDGDMDGEDWTVLTDLN